MSIINKKTLTAAVLTATVAISGTAVPLQAQIRQNPVRTSDLSDEDWNSWRIGVLTSEEADKAYIAKQYGNAIALYDKAIALFKNVQKSKPYWNKASLEHRIALMERKKAAAKSRLDEQLEMSDAPAADTTLQQKIATANADAIAEISELKLALTDAQKKNLRLKDNLERAKKTAEQVPAILKEREELEKKHTLLLIQYNEIRERAAADELNKATQAAYDEAKKRSETLEAELKKNQEITAQFRKSLTDLAKEKSELEKKCLEQQSRLDSVARLEKEVAALQKRIKGNHAVSQSTDSAHKAELARIKQELARKSQEADKASEELTKLRASMDLNAAARQLEQSVAALKADNNTLQNEMAKLRSDLAQAKKKLEADAETIAKTGALARNLTEQNNLLNADIAKAKKLLDKRNGEMQVLTKELDQAKADAARLRKERDGFAQEITRKPVDGSTSTAAELAQAKSLLKALQADNEKLKTARDDAQKKQDAFKKQIASLENAAAEAEAKIRKNETELKALLEKDSALKKSVKQISDLEKQLAEANSKVKTLDAALGKANGKVAESVTVAAELKVQQQKRQELEAALAKAKNEIASQKKTIDSAKMFDVEKLKAQLLEATKEMNAAKAKLEELRKLTSGTVRLEQELREIRESVILLESEKAALASEKEQLQQTIAYHERKAKEYETSAGNDALMRSLLQENKILKVELENARNVKPDEKFAAELSNAKDEIVKYQNELQRNNEEFRIMKSSVLELRLQIVALEKELKAAKQENAELKKNPAAAEALKKQQAAEQEKKALLDKLAENERKISHLTNLLSSLKQEQNAQVRVEELLKKENAELKMKLANAAPAVKALEARIAAMEKAAGEQVALNDQLKREKRELEKQLQAAQDAVIRKDPATAAIIKEKDELLKKLGEAQKTLNEAQKADQATIDTIKKQNDDLKKQLAATQKALNDVPGETASLKKQNDDLKKQLATAQESLKNVKAAPAEIKTVVDTAQVKKLEADLEKLQKELKVSKDQIADREQKITALQKDLKNIQDTMNKLAKNNAAAQSAEMAKLREENLKLNETIRSLRNEKTSAGENLIQVKNELISVKAQLEKLRSEVAADERGKKLTAQLDAMTAKSEKLEKEHSTALVSLDKLNQEKSKLSSRNSELEKQLDSVTRKSAMLQEEIRKWSAGNDAVVKGKMAEKDKVIDQLMKEHMAQIEEINKLKATLSNAETTAEAARKDAIRAREALEDLREKMADKPVTTTVTTGVRISASGKPLAKEEVKAAPAKAEAPVVEKKAELSPEIRKKYQDAMTEAGKQEKAGNPDEAMWKYLIAADLDPEAWQPHMAMSRIYLGAGKAVKAKQEYEKALRMGMERNPAHEQAIDNAGKNSK